MIKPRVFIPHVPMKFDPNVGMVPKFDTLQDASDYGELIVLIDAKMAIAGRPECLAKLKHGLKNFSPEDFFLPMGSHYFMMMSAIIIASKVDDIQILEWSTRERCYKVTRTSLNGM